MVFPDLPRLVPDPLWIGAGQVGGAPYRVAPASKAFLWRMVLVAHLARAQDCGYTATTFWRVLLRNQRHINGLFHAPFAKTLENC